MPISPSDAVIDVGFASDRGAVRENNEDSLIVSPPLFMVADGMGGHLAGEVASRLAVESLAESLNDDALSQISLQTLIDRADSAIRAETLGLAGTTVTGVVLREAAKALTWQVFNVGDSRTYLARGGEFKQVTQDHSQVQEMVNRGQLTEEEALVHPRRNVVTRAVGTGGDRDVDTWDITAEIGDKILVCSDGLTNELSNEAIAHLMSSAASAQEAADNLVAAALQAGGRDNISVVVIGLRGEENSASAAQSETQSETAPGSGTIEGAPSNEGSVSGSLSGSSTEQLAPQPGNA